MNVNFTNIFQGVGQIQLKNKHKNKAIKVKANSLNLIGDLFFL